MTPMNTQMKTLMSQHIFNSNICRILFATCLSALCLTALSTQAATITVTNTNDSGPGSFRQALADVHNEDTINFDSSLNGQTITLTSGELVVNRIVSINGPGPNNLAVDANHASRVFHVSGGASAGISGLSITNGSASGLYGGGIYNDHSTLSVINCTLSGNSANAPTGAGGGIFNDAFYGSSTLYVINCTLTGNSASYGYGGGIGNEGYNGSSMLYVLNCTLSGNSAASGGGIYSEGLLDGSATLEVLNSTLSGNSASFGGAIYARSDAFGSATLYVLHSTLSGNSAAGASGGGGIYNTGAITQLTSTVFNASDIFNASGMIGSLGYNLSSDDGGGFLTATGDQINTDPMLGPLQDNGGPAFTHTLLSGSPAIDAGDPSFDPYSFNPPLLEDQRGAGFPRVVNDRIDIGAFEVPPAPTPTPTPTPTATATATPTPTPTPTIQATVQTTPTGLAFSVDGTTYSSTQTFSWVPGSSHTIATTSPQNGAAGVRYTWMNWSGGGAISHTVTPTTNQTYTATFRTQYYLTMAHGTGGTVSPGSGWKNSGTSLSMGATPTSGYIFSNWTGSGAGSYSGTNNPASITMNGPITETASFTHSAVQVTVQTNPAGRSFTVDGTPYSAAQTFSWVPGSSHTIATTSPQSGGTGVQYAWMNWTGGGEISHAVAPTTNTTYTANFRTQYYLTMSHNTGGTVSPASGWKNSGAAVSIRAMPANGYSFTNWTGSGTGSFSGTTNPASITMSGPITETATFTHN